MSWDLFTKIVDEAVTIGPIDQYTLCGLGEPLLDPDILKRVKYIRKHLARVPINTFTNGHRLTRKWIKHLQAAGMTELYVSLNGVRKDQRQTIMGLSDYDRVAAVCKEAVAAEGPMKVTVKAVREKDLMEGEDAEEFLERWGGPQELGGNGFLHLEGNWAGLNGTVRVPHIRACIRAITQLMVLWDGRVGTCCHDAEGAQIFGDLNTQTLREVYSSPQYVAFREAHVEGRRQEIPLCAGCTDI